MSVDELMKHYNDESHVDEEGDLTPAEKLLETFRNGNRKEVAAWLVARTAEQPGYALCTALEMARAMTGSEVDTLAALMPEDT
jgi:hypothetical protein